MPKDSLVNDFLMQLSDTHARSEATLDLFNWLVSEGVEVDHAREVSILINMAYSNEDIGYTDISHSYADEALRIINADKKLDHMFTKFAKQQKSQD